jgi:RNA polymerase sigma factor (sigma-70 family)
MKFGNQVSGVDGHSEVRTVTTGSTGTGSETRNWLESFLAARPLLMRVISRLVRPDEIEDIVQETFVLSYAAARKQQIFNPKAFMMRTARNIALNALSRAERKLNFSLDDLSDEDMADNLESVEGICQSQEHFLIFCRAVAELPVNCRRVFILKKVYGLSQQEIADYLKISPSTVEKHVAKGMFATARYMDQHGYDVDNTSAEARIGLRSGKVKACD